VVGLSESEEMTMRVAVSEHLCTGQGRCYVVSPDVFQSDEDGFCAQRGTEFDVPAGLEEDAQLGVDTCPEGAIKIVTE
jgi:ferredoxin